MSPLKLGNSKIGTMVSLIQKSSLFTLVAALTLGGLLLLSAREAPASGHTEYEVKAAYLYNFGRFVDWPQEAPPTRASDFQICVLGEDPFGAALDSTISGEKIDGKNVSARRVSKIDEAAECRILFISLSERAQIKAMLSTLAKSSILTVSDEPQFIQKGGMVQFVLADGRVRFEINVGAARQAGLSLSSDLLKVAARVRQGPRPGD
jgi:hypothetical protein